MTISLSDVRRDLTARLFLGEAEASVLLEIVEVLIAYEAAKRSDANLEVEATADDLASYMDQLRDARRRLDDAIAKVTR